MIALEKNRTGANKIIIAIDGFSSCGKSTLAKQLSDALHYVYVDTGAMYRAVTLYFMQKQIDVTSIQAIEAALVEIHIDFEKKDGLQTTFLNGINVEAEIRSLAVSNKVSPISALHAVRVAMVDQQRRMGKKRGVVMDGRDIGTVVFPDAELKIFMTASDDVRAQRRYDELLGKGISTTFDEIQLNLKERDFMDSTRVESPLLQASDAVLLDNTELTTEEQFDLALNWAKEKINSETYKQVNT